MRKLFVITMLVALCATGASAQIWDLYAEFDYVANPNGVWSYGYSTSAGSEMSLFDYGYSYGGYMPIWTRYEGGALTHDPYIHKNPNISSLALCSGSPDSGAPYSIIRWTAPAAGVYQVDASFTMMPGQNADTGFWGGELDCYVFVNGVSAFDTYISGGYYSDFDPGPKTWSKQFALNAGDTVDFTAGPGPDPTNYFSDFANVNGSKITCIPEPSSILALLTGLAGVAGYIRRRK